MFRRLVLLVFLTLIIPVTLSAHFVYLVWNWNQLDGSDIDGFSIKRSLVEGGPYTTIGTVDNQTFNYTDNTVLPGNTYYYVIVATKVMVTDSGNSNEGIAVIPGIVIVVPFISQPSN